MLSSKNNDRIWYFDFLRIVATVFVIVIHLSAQKFDRVAVGTYEWMVFNVYDSLSRWAVPIFVMISGALFLNPARSFDMRIMMKKNLLRLATAFVFWSAVYAGVEYLQGQRLRNVAFHFIAGGIHLWFLYMLAGLYLIVPLLRRIAESEKAMKYFLLLWFGISILLNSCRPLIAYINKRYSGWLDVVLNDVNLQFVGGFSGYFVLGHYLHNTAISKKSRWAIYAFGMVGAAATIGATYLLSKKAGYKTVDYYGFFSLGVFLQTAAVFVLFKYNSPKIKNGTAEKLVAALSACSFGVYLVHFLFVKNSRLLFHMHTLTINPIFAVPLLTVIVFVYSFVISYVLHKIPLVKKYLV